MRIKSFRVWLAAYGVFLLATRPASAQVDSTPYYPIGSAEDFQPFEPFEWADYSDSSPVRQGWYFGFERYVSFINAPKKSRIGSDLVVPAMNTNPGAGVLSGDGFRNEISTHDTGFLNSGEAWGNRITFGLNEGNGGWEVVVYDGQPQDTIEFYDNVDVVFVDPPFGPFGVGHLDGFIASVPNPQLGPVVVAADEDLDLDGIFGRYFDGDGDGVVDPNNAADILPSVNQYDYDDLARLPVLFTRMRVRNKAYMDGVELMKVHNIGWLERDCHRLEFEWGVRFYKFRDRFNVTGEGGILDQSFWNTLADNHVVGPQVGVRWRQRRGRLELNTMGRFLAGFNFQTLKQDGGLGSNLGPLPPANVVGRPANNPAFFDPISFNHAAHQNEFAPAAEIRIDLRYYLTAEFSLKAGYTGQYTYGIVRAANAVDYTLPNMGLLTDNTNQSLWMNFATFGFEWNR